MSNAQQINTLQSHIEFFTRQKIGAVEESLMCGLTLG